MFYLKKKKEKNIYILVFRKQKLAAYRNLNWGDEGLGKKKEKKKKELFIQPCIFSPCHGSPKQRM